MIVGGSPPSSSEKQALRAWPSQPLDVAVKLAEAPTQQIGIPAGVAHLKTIRVPVMATHRQPGGDDPGLDPFRPDLVNPVEDELRHPPRRDVGKGLRDRVLGQKDARRHAVQAPDVACGLWEAEIDHTGELADAVAEVGDQTVAVVDQLPQLVAGRARQPCRGRPLLVRKAGDAERVDGGGVGALQIAFGDAPRSQRVEQGHHMPPPHQGGKQIAARNGRSAPAQPEPPGPFPATGTACRNPRHPRQSRRASRPS